MDQRLVFSYIYTTKFLSIRQGLEFERKEKFGFAATIPTTSLKETLKKWFEKVISKRNLLEILGKLLGSKGGSRFQKPPKGFLRSDLKRIGKNDLINRTYQMLKQLRKLHTLKYIQLRNELNQLIELVQ